MPLTAINQASDELVSALSGLKSPKITSAITKLLRAREAHSEKILTEIKGLREDADRVLKEGFPDSDLSGHKAAHKMMIQEAVIKAERWEFIKTKTLQAIIWIAIIAVGKALWGEAARMLAKA